MITFPDFYSSLIEFHDVYLFSAESKFRAVFCRSKQRTAQAMV